MNKKQNINIIGINVKGYKFTSLTKFLFWEDKKFINLIFGSNAQGKSSICNIVSEAKSIKDDNKYSSYKLLIDEYSNDINIRKYELGNNSNSNNNDTLELISGKHEKKYSSFFQYNCNNFFVFNEKWIDTFKTEINLNEQLFFLNKSFYTIFKKMSNIVILKLRNIETLIESDIESFSNYINSHDWKKVYSNIHKTYCKRKNIYDSNTKNDNCTDIDHIIIFEMLISLSFIQKYSKLNSYNKRKLANKIKSLKKEFYLNPDDLKNKEISMYENRKYINIFSLNKNIGKRLKYYFPQLSKEIKNIFPFFIKFVNENKKEINDYQYSGFFNTIYKLSKIKNTIKEYTNDPLLINSTDPFAHLLFAILCAKYDMKIWFTDAYDSINNLSLFIHKIKNETITELQKIGINKISKFINDGLLNITKNQNYLKIIWQENEDEKRFYGVVNGKITNFKNFSTSEKNLLSLIWFFGKLWLDIKSYSDENTQIYTKKNYIIMIDDPVSSFDQDNKENISEYIAYNIKETIKLIKKENKKIFKRIKEEEKKIELIKNSQNYEFISVKFAIFTHDIYIYKLFKNNLKNIINSHKDIISFKELKDNNLIDDYDIDLLEYNTTMKKLYFFVTNKDVKRKDCIGIGNSIRRVLEFFLYYYRNKGPKEIESLKKELKEKNNTKLHNINFTNLTSYLNNESHVNKNFGDMNFNIIKTPEYYKNLVKQLFCLINAIDNKHLVSHLKKYRRNIESIIQEWTAALESISSLND